MTRMFEKFAKWDLCKIKTKRFIGLSRSLLLTSSTASMLFRLVASSPPHQQRLVEQPPLPPPTAKRQQPRPRPPQGQWLSQYAQSQEPPTNPAAESALHSFCNTMHFQPISCFTVDTIPRPHWMLLRLYREHMNHTKSFFFFQ